MADKIGDFFTLLVIGAVAFHIITNANSAKTLSAVFDGTAKDITAATSG